jgi:hypothetical protein
MLIEHALKYAADGFAVFPVYEPERHHGGMMCSCGKPDCKGKHPRTPNGCLDATTDNETIKGWWTKWPNASIGLATGSLSGLAVLDLDGLAGAMSGNTLRLSSSVMSLTGNGKQLFYQDTEGKLKNSVKKIADGVDTRGEGGYVVVPPSLHPNGKRYVWASQPLARALLSPLPALFRSETPEQSQRSGVSVAPTSTIRRADGWIASALEEMKKGHVHNTLISVLGKFRIHNFSEDDTFKLLQPYALVDGRPFEGLRDKIAEIWRRYPVGTPQGLERSESIDTFLEDIKEVDWLCKPFVAKKSIGFVAGLPETLKTWLCIDFAVECARGGGLWIGLFPVTACKVLFVDQERWKGETQRRFNSVLAAKSIAHADLKESLFLKSGTTIRLNLDQSYQAFRTELLSMRPDLVIVDSFATFHTLPENDRTEIQKVLERIKELRNEIGCTFLFIHHETKYAYPNGEPAGEPNLGTMAGSVAIGAAAEFSMIVRKVQDNTSIVWHVKSTLAQKAKAFYASVLDVPNGIVVRGLND